MYIFSWTYSWNNTFLLALLHVLQNTFLGKYLDVYINNMYSRYKIYIFLFDTPHATFTVIRNFSWHWYEYLSKPTWI